MTGSGFHTAVAAWLRIWLVISAVSVMATPAGAAPQSTECSGGPAGASSFLLSFETQQERVRIIMNDSNESVVVPYRISGDRVFFEAKDHRFHFDPEMRLLTIHGSDGTSSGHAHCLP